MGDQAASTSNVVPAAESAAIASGHRALEAGDWPAARASFEAALEHHRSADALRGLSDALWWLGETHASVQAREAAHALASRDGDLAGAALDAVQLCFVYRASLGNAAASRGWMARAARLADDAAATDLAGWVALCRASVANDEGQLDQAHACASRASEQARSAGDTDLELCALAEMGTALLAMGRTDAGTALLDEAMAASLAGARPDTVVYTSCRTIVCCSLTGQVRRAKQWISAADEFTRRYGSPHLFAVCRTHHGRMLIGGGRWEAAERELLAALRLADRGEPALRAEILAALAGLRVDQGRCDEADRLLDGLGERPEAAVPLAALRIARGDAAAAVAVLERRLHGLDGSEAAVPLELLVASELLRGRRDSAAHAARRLTELAHGTGCEVALALADRAAGRMLGRSAPAAEHLRAAATQFTRLEMPVEAARCGLLLADSLREADPEAAVQEARDACLTFEQVGARPDADRAAALLRSLGARAARPRATSTDALTRREHEVLSLLAEGLTNRQIADRLYLSPKTVEHHVRSVLFKLGVSNRAEAAAFAVRRQTVDSGSD